MTGKDTDRLPEEQERGISIDLGYAPLDLGDGRQASLIDVPGHERLVRMMIAGATGVGLFLLAFGIQEGHQKDWADWIIAMIVGRRVFLTAFVLWQARNCIMPLGALKP